MNIIRILLFISFTFLLVGCINQEYNSLDNKSNESTPKEIKSIKTIPEVDNVINTTIQQLRKVKNNGFVTTNIEIQQSKLTITYKNKTGKTIGFGSMYTLEVLKNNKWISVAVLPNVGFTLWFKEIQSYSTCIDTVQLKHIYGELDPGHYRFIKKMSTNSVSFDIVGEFDIY